MSDIPHTKRGPCFCQRCMLEDLVKQARRIHRRLQKELADLDRAQRPTPADMAKQVIV